MTDLTSLADILIQAIGIGFAITMMAGFTVWAFWLVIRFFKGVSR